MLNFFSKLISWGFYVLFFLTPLAFFGDTSELFELNKMWVVFGLTTLIIASWLGKMIVQKRILVQRTPLDIPLLLFLLSQLLSTLFSLDQYTSFWGYYSRFNGGFLSLLCYILLFYALVSNIDKKTALRFLFVSVVSGICVALWGLPSHFGYDPTCLVFRGNLDVSCWTFAFQPKIRIFSTMGQPDWLAAYLIVLLPVSLAGTLAFANQKKHLPSYIFLGTTLLFFVDILYTRARSGYVGLAVSLVVFLGWYLLKQRENITLKTKQAFTHFHFLIFAVVGIALLTFLAGTGTVGIDKFLLPGVVQKLTPHSQTPVKPAVQQPQQSAPQQQGGDIGGGTDSGKIRLIVWKGALDAWAHNPILGTGVETFAYAYYMYRPAAHNLTSEWDYLYNKAHNEYLNYLATTGIVGLGTYLAFIFLFLFVAGKKLLQEEQINNLEYLLCLGLFAGFISMLVTNFFGFSVVIVNLFLFLFPGFFFLLFEMIDKDKVFALPKTIQTDKYQRTNGIMWFGIAVIFLIASFFTITLIRFWFADRSYALGQNLDHASDYQTAYQPLHDALSIRPSEPVFQDELALNDAILAQGLAQSDANAAFKLAQEAIQVNTMLVTNHPNIVTYWKSRVRILYTLAQSNPQLGQEALTAIAKAHELAPTDAKVAYNYGLILGQTGQLDKAVAMLQETIQLKPDYLDPYYALGVFYHTQAVDKNGKVINPAAQQKAIGQMQYILTHFDTKNKQALDALKSWGVQ